MKKLQTNDTLHICLQPNEFWSIGSKHGRISNDVYSWLAALFLNMKQSEHLL